MVDILDEIKDDIKQERLANFWKQYGGYVIVVALAIVLGTAGKVWWAHHTSSEQKALGKQYYEALRLMQSGETEKAESAFAALTKTDTPGYSAFASLAVAGNLIAKGETDKAVATYQSCLDKKGIDTALQELCRLFLASTLLEHQNDAKELPAHLEKLTQEGNVWRYTGQQLQGAYALKQGQWQEAYETFLRLATDEEAPGYLKAQAEELTSAIKENHPDVLQGKKG